MWRHFVPSVLQLALQYLEHVAGSPFMRGQSPGVGVTHITQASVVPGRLTSSCLLSSVRKVADASPNSSQRLPVRAAATHARLLLRTCSSQQRCWHADMLEPGIAIVASGEPVRVWSASEAMYGSGMQVAACGTGSVAPNRFKPIEPRRNLGAAVGAE